MFGLIELLARLLWVIIWLHLWSNNGVIGYYLLLTVYLVALLFDLVLIASLGLLLAT